MFSKYILLTEDKTFRSSHPEVFIGRGVLKICSKFTGEHPCLSVISIKLLCNFNETTHRHMCSPANFLHNFRTPFPKNNCGRLLLNITFLEWSQFVSNFSTISKSINYSFSDFPGRSFFLKIFQYFAAPAQPGLRKVETS